MTSHSSLLTAAALLCAGGLTIQAEPRPERNRRPYQNLDWGSAHQVLTASHMHVSNQAKLDVFLKRGFEFFTLSNYYPSAPYYPMSAMRSGQFRVRQEHAVVKDGVLTPGPFEWNAILAPWIDQVEEELRKSYPFQVGGPLFTNLPPHLLEAPNAEHHSFTNTHAHINAPGSLYASGTFDARNRFLSSTHGYNFGTGLPWQTAFAAMLGQLLIPDGGGITINHPYWSNLSDDTVQEMLDFDPRVLGIEVFNQSCAKIDKAWSEACWDRVLATGRQCFGFFVPDHGSTDGVNILLVQEKTAADCLRAYRLGNWYGAIMGKGLRFRKVTCDNNTVTAECDGDATIQVISKLGVIAEKQGRSLTCALTDPEKHVYARVKAVAANESGEMLFSQPFLLTP
ncbi:MAG: hypothetical protein PHC30_02815 [Lentisphaeria bacterium]|nr:hypothetical protein [Lentisphaeria bacterium]